VRAVDIKVLLDAVSLVGFPIVMCLVFMYYVKYLTDKNAEQIDKMNDQHRQETTELTKAVENNTLALTRLIEKMDKEG
jgi:hypothetical protein